MKYQEKRIVKKQRLTDKATYKKTGTWTCFLRLIETIGSYKVISKKVIKTGT